MNTTFYPLIIFKICIQQTQSILWIKQNRDLATVVFGYLIFLGLGLVFLYKTISNNHELLKISKIEQSDNLIKLNSSKQ